VHATKVMAARADAAALAELRKLGAVEPITQPLLTLTDLAGECRAWKEILASQVQSLSSLADQAADAPRLLPVVLAYERSLDRLGATLVSMGKLGVDETLGARLSRRQGELLAGCVRNILWRVGIDPGNPEVGTIVAAEMRKVGREEERRRSLPGRDAEDTGLAPVVELVTPAAAPISGWNQDLVTPDDYAMAGKGWEPKYRVVAVSQPGQAGLRVSVAETSGRKAHRSTARAPTGRARPGERRQDSRRMVAGRDRPARDTRDPWHRDHAGQEDR
jgi:hypothetical protein